MQRSVEKDRIELTSNWEATEAPSGLQFLGLSNGGLGRNNDGIQNKSIFESLHLSDHFRLVFSGAIVMDDTQTTQKGHVNSHIVFGDSVHGRR